MGCEDLVLLRSHQDLADVTHHLVAGRLYLRWSLSGGGIILVQECLQKWRRTFYFSPRRLLPRCASSGDGGAEDFSSALRLPSICLFSSFMHHYIFNTEVMINLWSNLSFPSFIVNTGLRVLLRGLDENIKPVQPRHNGDKRLVVEILLLGQMFRAPVSEELAALDVSPTKMFKYFSWTVMMHIISSMRVPTWRGQSLNPFCRWPFHLLNCWHLASPAILRTRSVKDIITPRIPVKLMLEVLKISWKSLQKKTLSLSSISLARFIPWHTSEWSCSLLCLKQILDSHWMLLWGEMVCISRWLQ